MKQDASRIVGICGLYCGACPVYLAHQKNDAELLETEMLDKFVAFHQGFLNHFKQRQTTEKALIAKMKGFWTFSHDLIDPDNLYINNLRRSQTELDYLRIVDQMFNTGNIRFK